MEGEGEDKYLWARIAPHVWGECALGAGARKPNAETETKLRVAKNRGDGCGAACAIFVLDNIVVQIPCDKIPAPAKFF